MKGFLVKDIRLTLSQKRYFGLVLMIGIFLATGSSVSSVTGYMTMLGAFFVISTLSYDEMNHGMSFLMTLPATRKDYVKEKYLYGMLLSFLFCCVSILFVLIGGLFRKEPLNLAEIFGTAGAVYAVMVVMFAFMMPFVIRLGSEKGRTAAIGILFILLAGIAGVESFRSKLLFLQNAESFLKQNTAAIIVISILIIAALFCISCVISIRMMEQKEF